MLLPSTRQHVCGVRSDEVLKGRSDEPWVACWHRRFVTVGLVLRKWTESCQARRPHKRRPFQHAVLPPPSSAPWFAGTYSTCDCAYIPYCTVVPVRRTPDTQTPRHPDIGWRLGSLGPTFSQSHPLRVHAGQSDDFDIHTDICERQWRDPDVSARPLCRAPRGFLR